MPHPLHVHQLGVPAADQQGHKGECRWVGGQKGRQEVTFEVVHRQHGFAQGQGQGLRSPGPHEERSRQARSGGVGHHVQVGQGTAALFHHLAHQGHHPPNVVTRGQLGHYPTIRFVHVDLGVQRLRTQLRQARAARIERHQGHPGFVAARLQTQNQHVAARLGVPLNGFRGRG